MIAVLDSKRRVTLPKGANPGDVFKVEEAGSGKYLLSRLEKPKNKIKLIKKNGLVYGLRGQPITMELTRALMDEFP